MRIDYKFGTARRVLVNIKIKILAAVAAVLTALCGFGPAAYAADKIYVALGDSIAYGYGLEDIASQSYPGIVSAQLGTKLKNYAVNGMTSGGLLAALQNMEKGSEGRKNIENASLITVSIGSNDLLSLLTRMPEPSFAEGTVTAASAAALEAWFTSSDSITDFEGGVETYKTNLPRIYAALRDLNPGAQMVMTEFYNPYYGVMIGEFDFGAFTDGYILKMNRALHEGQAAMDYKIAPIYGCFNQSGMTNVDMADYNLDPHPNAAGHASIADAVLGEVDPSALTAVSEKTETSAEAEVSSVTEAAAEAAAPVRDGTAGAETETEAKTDDNIKKIAGSALLVIAAVAAFGITAVVMTKSNGEYKKGS